MKDRPQKAAGTPRVLRGKWLRPDVPKEGWRVVGLYLRHHAERCQMCESQGVRHVHEMEHPDYAEALAVGSVCAAHMVQGYRGVDRRKADARNRRDRRGRWVSRSWEPREDGSEALSAYGYLTTVGLSEDGWQVRVTVEDAESMWHDGGFETKDDARLAGFDHIEEVGRLLPR